MNSKSLLHHITIASLLLFALPLHAAQQLDPQQEVEVYDYTLKHHSNVSNEVDSVDDLDLDDIPLELKAIIKADNSEDIQNQPNLLALVLEHKKKKESYTKYLFASTGLLENTQAVKKAHIYGYHLVQGYSNHFILGVLTFLHQLPDYNMHTVVVHQSQPICTNCNLITIHLFKQKLSSSKKGCHEKRFPSPAPPLACACFHSARFTQQQRRLSTLVDNFPKPQQPKKDISSNALYRQGEILIPANGQCLYTTLLLGYLLPAITNPQEYTRRYQQLTGKGYITVGFKKLVMCAANIDTLRKSSECKQLVKDFMTHMHFESGKWGGKEEIQKIADYLHVRIQEYIPNPENPTARVRSDLTSPQDTTTSPATTTIHIVRDNPLIKEALEYSESLQTAYHQQHYRLLARFSKLSTNTTTSEEKDEEKVQASCPQKKQKTKKEALIAHLKKSSNVNETEINNLKQWLDNESMDTDAIIEDLKDEAASNIQGYGKDQNLEIYQKIKDFFFPQNDAKLTSPDKANASLGEKTAEIQPQHLDQVNHVIPPEEEKLPSISENESMFILDDIPLQCEGHTNRVTSVSWSDGTRLASASWDKSVCIWDGATGKKLQQFTGHTDGVNSISWSPDGKYLASASDDKSVRIWNVATGNQSQKCTGHLSSVNSVNWSPDGKHLASGSWDKSVHIWNIANGNQVKEISHEHLDDVSSVSWSPNGKKLAFTSANIYDNENEVFSKKYAVFIWEGTTDKVRRFAGHTDSVNSVSWSPDGKYLASASDDKSIRIWDMATGNQLKQCTGHTACVNSVSWSPDGKYLASGSGDMFDKDYSVRVWDAANGNQLQILTGHTACVNSVSWSPDGKRLASASGDMNNQEYGVRIWTVTNIKGEHSLHFACLSGNRSMVIRLLDACKIGIESEDKYERTPFLCAAEKGQLETAKLLRQRGANIHAKDAWENNALHLACLHSGNVAMVTWLLDVCKIGLETKGQHKRTPFLCAAKKGTLAIAKLLKKRRADIHTIDACKNNALHWACLHSGNVAMVTWLLDKCQIGIETKGEYQKTSFLFAVQEGQLETAKLLKQRGANIHAKDAWGNNALHLACLHSGNVAMVTWLLDVCKIGLETKGQHKRTPFLCAAKKGTLAIAELLEKRSADIHAIDACKNNALHWACFHSGSVVMVTWLLDKCQIGIETKGEYQKTSFLFAVQEGQLAIAKLLRQRGANINAKSKKEENALQLVCARSGSDAMVNWLLDVCKIGIESKDKYEITPFLCAAKKGKLEIAKLLKNRDANIHAKSKSGNNALHFACYFSGSEAMVTWLLDDCKIGLETKGQHEMTPLLSAVQGGDLAIAKLLKERGANIHAKSKRGNNALHFACIYSESEAMLTWLLDECKIDIESKGQHEITPFLSAAKEGKMRIAKLLKQKGADVNKKDEYECNALHFACLFSGSVEMVTWLLDVCKIDIESKGQDEITPFLCAAKEGKMGIANLLKKRGANIHAKDKNNKNAFYLLKNKEKANELYDLFSQSDR